MNSRALLVSFLVLIVANASCSGEKEPEQDEAAYDPQPEYPETAATAEAPAPNYDTAPVEQNLVNYRPTEITLIMDNSRRYTGTYHASQVSQVCGELRPEESLTGARVFVVEFPYDGTPEITAVAFGSSKLVSGVTTTDEFDLNVGVMAKQGGQPSAFVIHTAPPVPRNMGQGMATLNSAAGTDTLRIVGANELGETIDMTVVCNPKTESAKPNLG